VKLRLFVVGSVGIGIGIGIVFVVVRRGGSSGIPISR